MERLRAPAASPSPPPDVPAPAGDPAGAGEGEPSTDGDRIAALELENVRLRRILADRDLEIEMLLEISRGTY